MSDVQLPPGWPTPPPGWLPRPGWQPDPTWAPPPDRWWEWLKDQYGQRAWNPVSPLSQGQPLTPGSPLPAWTPPAYSPPPTVRPKRSLQLPITVGAIALLVGLGAGFGIGHATSASNGKQATKATATTPTKSAVTQADQFTIFGKVTLTDLSAGWTENGECSGSGGYDDMTAGADVTLYNDKGNVVGTTSLASGTASAFGTCVFSFSFDAMPLTAPFYQVEVSHRGRITESISQLKSNGYEFDLTLGS